MGQYQFYACSTVVISSTSKRRKITTKSKKFATNRLLGDGHDDGP